MTKKKKSEECTEHIYGTSKETDLYESIEVDLVLALSQ